MNLRRRRHALICTAPTLLGSLLAATASGPRAAEQPVAKQPVSTAVRKWTNVDVELPAGDGAFPPGPGAELTPHCLICHSADMVLRQPPLTQDEWTAEINKMRNVFGAPLPADQVETLAKYLYGIDGRESAPPPG